MKSAARCLALLPGVAQRLQAGLDADTGLEHLACRGRQTIIKRVDQPEFQPVNPGRVGQFVKHALLGNGRLRDTKAAKRP